VKFKIHQNHVTGIPDSSGWGQVHDFTPVSEESFLKKGRLFTVISMLAQDKEALAEKENLIIGREILTRLHEEYYNKVGDSFELLKSAVEKVTKDFSSQGQSLQILVAIILQNKIIIKGIGKVEAWIIRSGKLAKIVSGENLDTNSVSGPILNNDVFFLGTTSFFNMFTPEALKALENFEGLNIKDSTLAVLGIKLEEIKETVIHQKPVIRET